MDTPSQARPTITELRFRREYWQYFIQNTVFAVFSLEMINFELLKSFLLKRRLFSINFLIDEDGCQKIYLPDMGYGSDNLGGVPFCIFWRTVRPWWGAPIKGRLFLVESCVVEFRMRGATYHGYTDDWIGGLTISEWNPTGSPEPMLRLRDRLIKSGRFHVQQDNWV